MRAQRGRLRFRRRLRLEQGQRSPAPCNKGGHTGGDKQPRLDDQADRHDDQRALQHSNICRHLLHRWVTCYPFSCADCPAIWLGWRTDEVTDNAVDPPKREAQRRTAAIRGMSCVAGITALRRAVAPLAAVETR